MSEAVEINLAVLTQRFNDFQERYARDQAATAEHQTDVVSRLDALNTKEQQAIGALKMAKVGYAVVGLIAVLLSSIGLPKLASWVLAIYRT